MAEKLTGETLYRLWWREMWATEGEKPQLQWEQLTDDRRAVWNRLVYQLDGPPVAPYTRPEYEPPVAPSNHIERSGNG